MIAKINFAKYICEVKKKKKFFFSRILTFLLKSLAENILGDYPGFRQSPKISELDWFKIGD